MFSSEFKKVIATILLLSMVVTSNGFFALANSVQSVVSVAAENTDEEPKNYHEMYYHEEYYEESIIMDPSDDVSGGNDAFIESTENLDDGNGSDDESQVLDEKKADESEKENSLDEQNIDEPEADDETNSSDKQNKEEPEEGENDEKIGIAEYDEKFDVETKPYDENESDNDTTKNNNDENETAIKNENDVNENTESEEKVEEEKNDIASTSEVDVDDENSKLQNGNEIENEIATISELDDEGLEALSFKKIASTSSLKLLDEVIFGAPGDSDWVGEHVHKACGVASGSDCVHTEYAAHGIDDGLDYHKLDFDNHLGEFIDKLAGYKIVGDDKVPVDHTEYFYLDDNVTFVFDDTTPTDQGTTIKHYEVNLQRDLYLCLNGHTLTNLTFKSDGNYKIIITDCVGGGAIKSVEEEAMMFQVPVQVFGLSSKITINATRVVNLNTLVRAANTTFYNVAFDGTNCPSFNKSVEENNCIIRLYHNDASVKLIFEECDVANWGQTTLAERNETGKLLLRFQTTGTVILKNVNVHDNVGVQSALFYVDGSTNVLFKGRNEFYNNVIDSTDQTHNAFSISGDSVIRIQDDGLYIHDNSQLKTQGGTRFIPTSGNGTVEIEAGATFAINNNKIAKLLSNNNTVILDVGRTFNCYGNLTVTNNKVINCGDSTTGTYINAIRMQENKPIKLGTGIVTVRDNKSYKDDCVTDPDEYIYMNHHMTQVYSVSLNTSCLFEMIGTNKFNSNNYIEGIGFPNGQSGKIIRWTSATVDAADLDKYNECLKADNFYFPDYEIGIVSEYAKPVHNQVGHRHKVCGVAEGVACTHGVEAGAHTDSIGYSELRSGFSVANATALIKGLATSDAEAHFYLTNDIVSATTINIQLNRDVYICLNGHKMKNISFKTSAKKMYITNCSGTVSDLEYDVAENVFGITNCCVQIYGINKNIRVKGTRLLATSNANSNGSVFYNIECDGTGIAADSSQDFAWISIGGITITFDDVLINKYDEAIRVMFCIEKNLTVNMRDVKICNNAGLTGPLLAIGNQNGRTTINFNGNNEFNGNRINAAMTDARYNRIIQIDKGDINVNGILNVHDNYLSNANKMFVLEDEGVFTVSESGTFKFNNNVLKNFKNNMHIIDCYDGSQLNLLGNFEFVENKVYNCNEAASVERIAGLVRGTTARFVIGTGSITIRGNASYSDEGSTAANEVIYPGYHVYQVFAWTGTIDSIFEMAAGKRFNPGNRIEGVSFRNGQTGKIIKWTDNEVDDLSIVTTVFTADTFIANLKVDIINDYAVITGNDNHSHKICGIGGTEACTHTEKAAHSDVAYYTKLNDSLTFDAKVQLICGASATEAPVYLYLESDLTSDTVKTITLLRDAYICLNGHSITNIRFAGNGKKMCVTNCQDTKSVITFKASTLYVFLLNVEAYGKKMDTGYNLGVNALCVSLVQSPYNSESSLYRVDIDGTGVTGDSSRNRIHNANENGTLILEDVTLRDCSAQSRTCILQSGASEGTFIIKNLDAYNLTNMNYGLAIFGGAGTTKTILKGHNKIHGNTTNANTNYFVSSNEGIFTVEEGATLEIYENTLIKSDQAFNVFKIHRTDTGYLNARPNSNIYIHDNIFYKNTHYQTFMALFGQDNQYALGNIKVVNNKYYNCNASNKSGDYLSGFTTDDNINIILGTGSFIVKDNKAYSDNRGETEAGDTYLAHHVYGIMTGHRNEIFKQLPGTKFNTETRVENVGFIANATGTLIKWTEETVNAEDLDKYADSFTADTYFMEDYIVKRQGDYVVIGSREEHEHKLCGVAAGVACLHTEIASHSEVFNYSKIGQDTVNNKENFVKIFNGNYSQGAGDGELYVYLGADISVTSVMELNPARPVNLCLNGHTMSGFRFTGSNKVTITNCNAQMGTFREILDTEVCFTANTYLYGINRNLTINSPRIADVGGAKARYNKEIAFYSTIFSGKGMKTGSFEQLFFKNDYSPTIKGTVEDCLFTEFTSANMVGIYQTNSTCKIVFKNLDIATNSVTGNYLFGDHSGAQVTFKGKNRFWNNKFTTTGSGTKHVFKVDNSGASIVVDGMAGDGIFIENTSMKSNSGLLMINGNFTLNKDATISVKNNKINKTDSALTHISTITGNVKLKGNVEITDNKVLNCGTSNTSYITAMRIIANNSIVLGDGKIVVKDNLSYKDEALTLVNDAEYPAQHMYQVLANANTFPIFEMALGTKMSGESKLDGIAFYSADGVGKILKWDSDTYNDENDHSNIFIADTFLNEYVEEAVENGYARIRYRDDVVWDHASHKVCGLVHGVAPCTHSEVAAHTENLEYHKISPNVLSNVAALINANAGDTPMYFYLNSDITTTVSTQITLSNDIYICLNGHSIVGWTFYSTTGKTAYITNCKTNISRIENTTADNVLLFRNNVQLYGINKNIAVKSPNLTATYAKEVVFYDTLFDNEGRTTKTNVTVIQTTTNGATFNIEKCKFKNFESGMEMIKTLANNATVVLKDTEFEQCNNMASKFINMYNDASSRNKIIFKGETSIHDCINTSDNSNSGAVLDFAYTDVIVEEGASFKYYNNQLMTGNRICLIWFNTTNLTVKKNASFEVYDNLMCQYKSDSRTAVISISSNPSTIDVLGDLKVTGNKVVDCTYATSHYLAAVELRGGVINVGTGSIIIKDNTSAKNADGTGEVDESVRGYHMFDLYSANTNNIFVVKAGAKLNPNSRINATFFDTKDGKIVKWDNTTTDDLNAYKTIFTTDTYGDDSGMDVLLKDGYVVVASRDNEHWHKICGVATDSVCTHTLVAEHTNYYQYTRIHDSTTVDGLVSLLQGASTTEAPQYLFLKKNYSVTSARVITLKRNVYLCLNGYSLTGFRFAGAGKKIYICNCRETKATISSNLDTNVTFTTGLEIYGINKNITVSCGRVMDVTDEHNNPNNVFYDINMTGKDSRDLGGVATFWFYRNNGNISFERVDMYKYIKGGGFLGGGGKSMNISFKDVNISNIEVAGYLWNSWQNNSAIINWHFYGNVTIDGAKTRGDVNLNQWSGGKFTIYDKATLSFINCETNVNQQRFIYLGTNGKLNINEGGTLVIDNNKLNRINKSGTVQSILVVDGAVSGSELNVLGNLQITNNKFINCENTTANLPLAGLRLVGNTKTMKVGSGWMKIYGNKAYKDSSALEVVDDIATPKHHMFETYIDNKNVPFVQEAGTKFNAAESRVDNFSFSSIDYTGKIMKWTSTEVDDSYVGRFHDVFRVDKYWDDDLITKVEDEYGIVKYGDPNHKHKLCGVSTASACLHNNAVNHTSEIGYRKISNMYTTKTEIKTLLQTGGAFALTSDFDTRNLSGTGDQFITITPAADLYICLNGHTLNGVRFVGATNRNVYITNCQTTTSTFSNDITSHAMFINIGGEIYGINRNITITQDVLANTTGASGQNIRLYSALFSENSSAAQAYPYIEMFETSSQTSFIEDCDFSNINTTYFLKNDKARAFVFKNNSFHDMRFNNSFMDFSGGAAQVMWQGTNIIDKVVYANGASTYFMRYSTNTGNVIKIDGDLKITNVKSIWDTNHFVYVGAGQLGIEENSNLEIRNNTLYNSAMAGKALLYTGTNATMYIYGSLNISDNYFEGTRRSHADSGLWYANKNNPIEIGSTSIIIKNNTTQNSKANVRNLYSYYSGSDTSGIFEQKAGTRFNAVNSLIESVAINSEDYTGTIYPYWTTTNVKGIDEGVDYASVFIADIYAGRKGLIIAKEENRVFITYGDHYHKLCGTLATQSCTHTIMPDHGMGDIPTINRAYNSLSWGSTEQLKSKLENGGTYFLTKKVKLDTPLVINLQADLYLCLGGCYMENVIFTSSNGSKAYITTCIEEIEEPEEEEDEYDDEGNLLPKDESKRNDRNEVALVATSSSATALFDLNVEVYSPYNILKIYANKLYENSGSNKKVTLSGVTLSNDVLTANNYDYIKMSDGDEMIWENVTVASMSDVNHVVNADNSTVTFGGNVAITGNKFNNAVFNFDEAKLDQVSGAIDIYDNIIDVKSQDQSLIRVSTESNLKGDLIVTSNKFVNAGSANNQGYLSILRVDAPGFINLGNTRIYMADNNVYSDSLGTIKTDVETYKCHYLHGIYSDNYDGIFVQDAGTSLNTSTSVNVAFASPKYKGTVVKSWSSGEVYDTMFKADKNIDGFTGFDRLRMNVALEDTDLIVDDRIRIYFKEGILEKLNKGYSAISFKQIVPWGEPYNLTDEWFRQENRVILGYVDERGVRYSIGTYPVGLVLDRGSITLTALWSNRYAKDEYVDTNPGYYDTTIKRNAVIVNGRWIYDRTMRKWMYYLNASENAIDNLFPDGDAGLHVGMASTDMSGYVRNGIYQIYYNGQSYFFKFDENGYMVTGISQANGDYYYFNESGILEGAMQFAPIVTSNKKIIFDIYGRIVREVDINTGEVTVLNATYQRMVGMDDYYEPIPSLVGWY